MIHGSRRLRGATAEAHLVERGDELFALEGRGEGGRLRDCELGLVNGTQEIRRSDGRATYQVSEEEEVFRAARR